MVADSPKDLVAFGYAPGNYTCKCVTCGSEFVGDKRAARCQRCAERLRAIQPVEVRPSNERVDSTELYYAEMEAARNTTEDAYFRPRGDDDNAATRRTFRAGFERAFRLLWRAAKERQSDASSQQCEHPQLFVQGPVWIERFTPCPLCERDQLRQMRSDETTARDILQCLVDTCELATSAPWPALDEARAFLSGSPEAPRETSRCIHDRVVCEPCAQMAVRFHEKTIALAQEISERHTRINKLLYGPEASKGMMLGPMDSDAAHADRGRLLSMLTPEQRGTVEPTPKPTRDADHCDYPDCEQHWTHVVAKARALLEPLADCDPAIRQWLKTADLPSLRLGPSSRLPAGTKVTLLGPLLYGQPADGWKIENADEPRDLRYRVRHPNGCIVYVPADLVRQVKASAPHAHVWKEAPDSGLALCACGDYSEDWYCPESADHVCHYDNGDRDQCDFCGLPEERK